MRTRRWLVPAVLSLVALLTVTAATAALSGYPAISAFRGDEAAGGWAYTVEQEQSGKLLVSIHAQVNDPAVREQYAQDARDAALGLARAAKGDVPVQLTMARPLPLDEARAMAKEVGLNAEHVTLEARDSAGALNSVGARAAGEEIVAEKTLEPGLEMNDLHLVGVVVLQGKVPASSLTALAEDPRVYIVDTLHRALARDLAEQYGVEVDDVEVSAPSPFWSLGVERDAR